MSQQAELKLAIREQLKAIAPQAKVVSTRKARPVVRLAAHAWPYHLAFLDLDVTGVERMNWAMQLRWLQPGTAIVLLTRSGSEEERERAAAAGMGYEPADPPIETTRSVLARALDAASAGHPWMTHPPRGALAKGGM